MSTCLISAGGIPVVRPLLLRYLNGPWSLMLPAETYNQPVKLVDRKFHVFAVVLILILLASHFVHMLSE
jgi:hypothetical protein